MELKLLKEQIESGQIPNNVWIFVGEDDFIPRQYTHAIAKIKSLKIHTVEDVGSVLYSIDNVFGDGDSFTGELVVISTDKFEFLDTSILAISNMVIIAKSIDKGTEKLFEDNVIHVPKLEDWCVKDYIYSKLPGLSDKSKDWLFNLCGKNMYRVYQEVEKLSVFPEKQQQMVFDDMVSENMFGDLTNIVVFDFINAVISKNKEKVSSIYTDIDKIGINPMGFFVLIYNNVKKMISVKCAQNKNALGIPQKQLYAIDRTASLYSINKLRQLFELLTSIDYKVKSGDFDTSYIIDYILIRVMV